MHAHELIRYMRRRIEKATERTMISCSKYNGVVALIIESGVLYTTSSVRKISVILTHDVANHRGYLILIHRFSL